MARVGVSTGAVARGDFRGAWETLAPLALPAIEFSALREHELGPLAAWLSEIALPAGLDISIHAPGKLVEMSERGLIDRLAPLAARGWRIVVHPRVIGTPEAWRSLGRALCVENMDMRERGRTVDELRPFFDALPEASFCLDLGHARQVDPTLAVARTLVKEYGGRIAQVHLSEVDSECRHRRLSMASVWSLAALASRLPDVPVILESEMTLADLAREIAMAQQIFTPAHEASAV